MQKAIAENSLNQAWNDT